VIVVTTDFVTGCEIEETLGLVRGNTVRAKHIGRDWMAGFRQVVGGEIKSYTDMLQEAREQALERMAAQAEEAGADAVITCRLVTSEIMQRASEVLAYGTAVKLRPAGGEGTSGRVPSFGREES